MRSDSNAPRAKREGSGDSTSLRRVELELKRVLSLQSRVDDKTDPDRLPR